MSAFYNEIDRYPAAWLRNLIDAGHIAPGVVDERSIVDLQPEELRGYTQAHFFAGIGVWSHALRLAGWADGDGVWTGSCPCQPFSAAGKRGGHADERHLWPAWFRLIRECRPRVVFGEQVASKDGLAWLDAVRADMEGEGYAFGAVDLCAAGVGAPHIRQRAFFVADASGGRWDGRSLVARGSAVGRVVAAGAGEDGRVAVPDSGIGPARERVGNEGERGYLRPQGHDAGRDGATGELADDASDGRFGKNPGGVGGGERSEEGGEPEPRVTTEAAGDGGATGELADDHGQGRHRLEAARVHGRRPRSSSEVAAEGHADGPRGNDADGCGPAGAAARREPGFVEHAGDQGLEGLAGHERNGNEPGRLGADQAGSVAQAGALSFWSDAEWVWCRDGVWRPHGPESFPLTMAHGATKGLGRNGSGEGGAYRALYDSEGRPVGQAPSRVGMLRAYGNAIVAPLAAEFVRAFMEASGAPGGGSCE